MITNTNTLDTLNTRIEKLEQFKIQVTAVVATIIALFGGISIFFSLYINSFNDVEAISEQIDYKKIQVLKEIDQEIANNILTNLDQIEFRDGHIGDFSRGSNLHWSTTVPKETKAVFVQIQEEHGKGHANYSVKRVILTPAKDQESSSKVDVEWDIEYVNDDRLSTVYKMLIIK